MSIHKKTSQFNMFKQVNPDKGIATILQITFPTPPPTTQTEPRVGKILQIQILLTAYWVSRGCGRKLKKETNYQIC